MSVIVFETMAVRGGRLPLLEAHLARLRAGAATLGLPAPPVGLAGAARARAGAGGDRIVRLAWSGLEAQWSERPLEGPEAWRLQAVGEPHPGYPVKTEDRAAFDRALELAGAADADEALLSTPAGTVVEAARFAVVWVESGVVCYPDPELGGLPSIGLARLLAVAAECGIEVQALWKGASDLAGRPVGLVNAARGLVRVASLNGVPVGSSDLLGDLAEAFWPPA